MADLRWLDAVVILVYMAAMLLVGRSFAKRQTTTEAYFVAKRSIPSWAMGISIYAALITSITFIAYPGSAWMRADRFPVTPFFSARCRASSTPRSRCITIRATPP